MGVKERSSDELAWSDEFPPLNLWNYPKMDREYIAAPGSWFPVDNEQAKRLAHAEALATKAEFEKQLAKEELLASKQHFPNVRKEYTGGSVSYYRVTVAKPTSKDLPPYIAECNDIIEALKMNYAEGNAFKAIWRRAAATNLGLSKQGYKDGKYDAEKVEFFGHRLVEQSS